MENSKYFFEYLLLRQHNLAGKMESSTTAPTPKKKRTFVCSEKFRGRDYSSSDLRKREKWFSIHETLKFVHVDFFRTKKLGMNFYNILIVSCFCY